MSLRQRTAVLIAASVAALLAAAGALASFSPRVGALASASSTVTIGYELGAGDDPARKLQLYLPVDYLDLFSDAQAAQVGTVTATMNVGDQGGSAITMNGTITNVQTASAAGTSISYAGANSTLTALSTACAGHAANSTYWLLNLSGGGQSIVLPVFVDALLIADNYSNLYGVVMTICLPPPDVPAGTAGRATAGTKVTSLKMSLPGQFSYPDGRTLWRALATPYTPGTGQANAAGAVETQTLVRTPRAVTVATAKGPGGTTVAVGRVTAGDRGVAGATVTIKSHGKTIATTKTKRSDGKYSVTIPAGTTTLVVQATAPQLDLPCASQLFASTCIGTRITAFVAAGKSS